MRNNKFKITFLLAAVSVVLLLTVIFVPGIRAMNVNAKASAAKVENRQGTARVNIEAGIQKKVSQSVAQKSQPASSSNSSAKKNEKLSFDQIVKQRGIKSLYPGLVILVDKSEHTLSLVYNGETLKSYHTDFGNGGEGAKHVFGDYKTPEGEYYVTNKEDMDPPDYYLGSRWLGVSYPNIQDAQIGLKQGVIDTDTYNDIVNANKNGDNPPQDTALGGNIGIHGGTIAAFGSDWTWGCVGLKNKDIEEFWGYIRVGTKIIIQK